ncbi:MAG: hypothetical protein MZV63_37665 [Marinilabiliales bacterium]|nr:hypothetical protein [Marinilabiliales bacterium]
MTSAQSLTAPYRMEQQQVLKDLGRWTAKHKEAIYGTGAGLPDGLF